MSLNSYGYKLSHEILEISERSVRFMMIHPPKEILEYSKTFELYEVYVDEIDRSVLRSVAPDEAVETFIKWFAFMTGKKPEIVRWIK